MIRRAAFLFLSLGLSGCATYQSKVSPARGLLEQGRAADAADALRPLAETADGDQLAYLLDYATALQAAGRSEDSVRAFLRADRLGEEVDYHSVSRVTGSLLLNEEVKQYKGDTFERIFINAQLALNFLALGKLDDALVEARRINEKYLKLRGEEKKNFELNPFAKYLSAVIWEADRKYDDAYIAYAEAYKISPLIEGLPEDLIRSAKLSRRDDQYAKWKKEFPHVKEDKSWYDRSLGEIIVIAQVGWGPRKVFNRMDARWPELQPIFNTTKSVRAEAADVVARGNLVYDVQGAAIQTLEDDRLSLFGRRVGGMVAKEVAADQIRQKNELLGAVAWIALHATDRADLRQWSTLPRNVQIVRLRVKPGLHDVRVQGLDHSGQPTADHLEAKAVSVKAGAKKFLVWRAFR